MKLLKQLEILQQAGTSAGLSDGQLLDRFLQGSDEAAEPAFAALVDRHAGLVLRVCRQVLDDEHDAQDASQATFLILARKARSIDRRQSVASWLYGVALRVAQRARLAAARRQKREERGGAILAARRASLASDDQVADGERWARLHAELGRLPESFRAPLVLCYLQGLTQEQAAAQLHCPLGTVQSRLARGRAKLKSRLEARGGDVSALLLAPALRGEHLLRVPDSWAEAAVRLALEFARGKGGAAVGKSVISAVLAEDVMRAFVMIKLKVGLAALFLLTGMLVSGAVLWAGQGGGQAGDHKAHTVVIAKQHDEPKKAQQKQAEEPREVDRTVRGTVRDEQGRPISKVWVGDGVEIRKGKWTVQPLGLRGPDRTDRQGGFSVQVFISSRFPAREIVFATADFSLQAIHVVRKDDPGRPLDITLHPAREVRARVIEPLETPSREGLYCDLATVDPAHASLYDIPAIGTKGAFWGRPIRDEETAGAAPGRTHRLDIRLPAGKYMLRFKSSVVYDTAELVVPPGDGVLDLPDITVRTLPWVKMLGKPAAEIEAVDLAGKPVKLADFRGKVVVLAFWSSMWPSENRPFQRLDRMLPEFKDKPLTVVAIHDASISSLTRFKQVVEPIRNQLSVGDRIHWLLDRVPHGKGRNPPLPAGEPGSGRTADLYGDPATYYVIDLAGKLVWAVKPDLPNLTTYAVDRQGKLVINSHDVVLGRVNVKGVSINALRTQLEDSFGMPRSSGLKEEARAPTVIKGKVVDLLGRDLPEATVEYDRDKDGTKTVRTGPAGEFRFSLAPQDEGSYRSITVWADGLLARDFLLHIEDEGTEERLAPEEFWVRPDGTITRPLRLGPGVTVTGRLMREGKPVAGIAVGLGFIDETGILYPTEKIACKTDEHGSFRFDQVWPRYDCWVFVELGTLANQATVIPRRFHTLEDGSTLDVGVLKIEKGRKLVGRLVCSDGKVLPPTAYLEASVPNVDGTLRAKTDTLQRFEFTGIPDGPIRLTLLNWAAFEAIDYHLSLKNACLDPEVLNVLEGRVDHDMTDLTILLEPGELLRKRLPFFEADPTALADFHDAKAGPITGVPPGDYPSK